MCSTVSVPTEIPSFVTPLSNVMARAGQKVKLECEVKGIPPPNLSWTHDGKFVKETVDLKVREVWFYLASSTSTYNLE